MSVRIPCAKNIVPAILILLGCLSVAGCGSNEPAAASASQAHEHSEAEAVA